MFHLQICQIVYPSILGCKQQFNIDYKAYVFSDAWWEIDCPNWSDVITFSASTVIISSYSDASDDNT